ncbi:MAG: ACT domain-containing protein [Candidatus Hydrothermarchaeota archaeon]|nr:ACT domain-containing protein [Candidatus Hydrothermarchaeota archaeon]
MNICGSKSISEAARKVLAGYPYLEEYMTLRIINNRALARAIYRDVRRECGEVKLQSVVTAVRRFPISKTKSERNKILKILSESEVNLRYDIGVATIMLDSEVPKKLDELRREIGEETYMLIQGIQTLTIVAEERLLSLFEKLFNGKIAEIKRGLALIVVMSPKEIIRTPGVIAHLASILALEKINVVEMMSSHTETSFIVEERDALRAIEVIRNEIKRVRR